MARHIFQACLVWIYTQSNITQASIQMFLMRSLGHCLQTCGVTREENTRGCEREVQE
jgi:hypothetical protein